MTKNMNAKQLEMVVAADALASNRFADALLILTTRCGMDRSTALLHMAPMPTPTVGDVLESSWGYEQTNIDFYEVVAVTAASVRIRKLMNRNAGRTETHDVVMPAIGQYDADDDAGPKGRTVRIQKGHRESGYCVKIASYATAYLWDGQPAHETAAGYGH